MKIRIELDDTITEDEVLIRCRCLGDEIRQIQRDVSEVTAKGEQFVFYKGDTEYYLKLDEVLFFETENNSISVHTRDNIYQTKYKLYELEELLPGHFMRVSKSTILNTNHIYSISRNISAASTVQFQDSHKQVFVSRYYSKPLKCKLEEKEDKKMKEVKKRGTGRIFWGIFLVLGAVLLIVSQLGMMEGIGFWTVVGTLFFVAILLKSLVTLEFTGIFFSAAFLIIIYDEQLALEAITPWPVLGAALLLSIGFHMLFRRKHRYYEYHYDYDYDAERKGTECEFDEVIDEQDGDTVHFGTTFGSSIKYVNTDDFKRADLHCSFGALAVYFDNAVMQQEKAVINLDVSFAGVEIYIPKTWNVVNNVHTSLGALEEKNHNAADGLHTVILNGKTSFSGVEITYI